MEEKFLAESRDREALIKLYDVVKGYQVQTDLDRKLLLGIWMTKEKAAPARLVPASYLSNPTDDQKP